MSPAAVFVCCLAALSTRSVEAISRSGMSHLRAGVRASTSHGQQPPAGMVAAAPAVSPAEQSANLFNKMDVNKDGKVDQNEFVVAQQTGVLPLAAAPAPAVALAPGPAAVMAMAPGPAPSPAADELPAHHLVPPSLPENIPEPPPPPRAPPAEPAPPPHPPLEGQLVGPPPGENSMEAAGNVTAMMAGVPGLDLDGTDPLQSPNTPPPIPPALTPPELPKIIEPMAPPQPLMPALMTPAPVAFGVDMASTFPGNNGPLGVVRMPALPDFFAPLSSNPVGA